MLVETIERKRFGPLTLLLKRCGPEAHFLERREPSADTGDPAPTDWVRWIIDEHSGDLKFVPALPNRSVVVRPEAEIHVPPGESALFFVSIPLWVQVQLADKTGKSLFETPVVVLSNIWFGDTMSGELCYSLTTRARTSLGSVPEDAHQAICPVRVKNGSKEPLEFSRLCVRAPHLRLYATERHMWTEQVEVKYLGEAEGSEVTYQGKPPAYEEGCKLLAKARESREAVLFLRSFNYLKALAG